MRRVAAAVLVGALALIGCGKKGDPLPPLATRPMPAADLEAWQDGTRVLLRAGFPDSTVAGMALPAVDAIEVWRAETSLDLSNLSPGVLAPRSKRIATLSGDSLSGATRGDRLVWSDLLPDDWLDSSAPRRRLVYQLVVSSAGGFSEPSEPAAVTARSLVYAPELLDVSISESGIKMVIRLRGESRGALIFRRRPGEVESLDPVGRVEDPDVVFEDHGVSPGCWLYRASALLDEEGARGPRGREISVEFVDLFPPPRPGPPEVFRERERVRLLWEPVVAGDLAGYQVDRSLECWQPWRLAAELIEETSWSEPVAAEERVCYRLRSVDLSGNSSASSAESEAPPF